MPFYLWGGFLCAVCCLLRVLTKRTWKSTLEIYKPTFIVSHVTQISAEWLIENGIDWVILDLDNTLKPVFRKTVPSEIVAWLQELRAKGITICVVTNRYESPIVWHLRRNLDIICIPCGIFALHGCGAKPIPWGVHKACKQLNLAASTCAMIGDQLRKDIAAANHAGVKIAGLVHPLSPWEMPTTMWKRRKERKILQEVRNNTKFLTLNSFRTVLSTL